MKSLTEFRENFKENLLELHWKQWSTLGVSSHIEETENIIDLEALIISSILMGTYDKRLLASSLEWIRKNKEWVSISRIKQIGKHFLKVDKQLKKPLLYKELMDCILLLLKDSTVNKESKIANESNIYGDYKNLLSGLENRNVTVEPVIKKSPLLQLYLRGIFGINARPEILLYLLSEGKGNSNQIARQIYFDQKIVYRILKRWAMAGFIKEETGKKETIYSLRSDQKFINSKKSGKNYINWCRVFYFLSRLLAFATIKPWDQDKYLLSSLFRDVSQEAAVIGSYFNISMPESDLFKGEEFFSPFASALLKILKR